MPIENIQNLGRGKDHMDASNRVKVNDANIVLIRLTNMLCYAPTVVNMSDVTFCIGLDAALTLDKIVEWLELQVTKACTKSFKSILIAINMRVKTLNLAEKIAVFMLLNLDCSTNGC